MKIGSELITTAGITGARARIATRLRRCALLQLAGAAARAFGEHAEDARSSPPSTACVMALSPSPRWMGKQPL